MLEPLVMCPAFSALLLSFGGVGGAFVGRLPLNRRNRKLAGAQE